MLDDARYSVEIVSGILPMFLYVAMALDMQTVALFVLKAIWPEPLLNTVWLGTRPFSGIAAIILLAISAKSSVNPSPKELAGPLNTAIVSLS